MGAARHPESFRGSMPFFRLTMAGRRAVDLVGLHVSLFPMIKVTERAVAHLRQLLAEHSAAPGKGLRVQVAKGGCSGMQYEMSLDLPQENDAVIEQDNVAFLIDPESASFLRDATLDFEDGLTGAGFRIVNPNAARICGCGTSFEPVRPA